MLPRNDAERWHALTVRDPAHTNSFIYAVTTTKIYCRPNCPSRLARRANIEFFKSPSQAVAAGYRACRRCKPEQVDGFEDDGVEKVRKAVAVIKEKGARGEKISLAELSKEVGLSKWHLQRAFKKRIGVSPRAMGESIEKEAGQEGKQSSEALQGDAQSTKVQMEDPSLFALTPGSTAGLTDSTSWSSSYDVSNLPTPMLLPLDMMPETEDVDWLVGYDADPAQMPYLPQSEQDWNFASTTYFDPGVEDMLRDLFPEIH